MKKKFVLCLVMVISIISMTGCRNKAGLGFKLNGKTYYFTNGFLDDTVVKSTQAAISVAEAKALYYAVKYNYENVLTSNIWDRYIGDTKMEDYVEDDVKELLLSIVMVNELAADGSVKLTSDEEAEADETGKKIFEKLQERMPGKVDEEALCLISRKLALCDKVYDEYTVNVNTEVSIDEARVIKIQYIFSKESIRGIEKAMEEIEEGYDFLTVAKKYSESPEYTATIGRNEMTMDFETAAFNLETGEISAVVSCDNGFYLIKCIDDNVEGRYENRVEEIIEKRKNDHFFEILDEFSKDLYLEFDEKKWEESFS